MMIMAAVMLFAKVTILAPKEGAAADFEAGYKRHLDWHLSVGDKWNWYGWTVVTGERFGSFVDATFDRTPAELDSPVAPAEDATDNAKNVLPYARLVSTAIYRHRPDLCGGTSAAAAGRISSMVSVRVTPGGEVRFESALREAKFSGLCLELVSGGPSPSYLLFRSFDALSGLITSPRLGQIPEVESVTVEALRYRPDLSYLPEPRR